MIFVFIQSIPSNSKKLFPYRISILDRDTSVFLEFTFRPECALPQKLCSHLDIDRMKLLDSPAFCDIAHELIELFQENHLQFLNTNQFYLLKSLFKSIGFNFNIKPSYYFSGNKRDIDVQEEFISSLSRKRNPYSPEFSKKLLELINHQSDINVAYSNRPEHEMDQGVTNIIKQIDNKPGAYFFYDDEGNVIYVGKAKDLRKRLQSHFSRNDNKSNVDYSKVADITVEYTGNDIVAQLVEAENIKKLKPVYNSQQVENAAPFIINIGRTAKGIAKASIVRKDYVDNLPEQYFNRASVKSALEQFCTLFSLCRKHCGLERIKGPCTRSRVRKLPCVCSGDVDIENYNSSFNTALKTFIEVKSREIYKLIGRSTNEDCFIYLLNGIYQGYGFIDREESISNENDILSRITIQKNNYDTNRIIGTYIKNSTPIEF